MRLKVFRAQVAMALSALEKEAARGAADGRIHYAVYDLKSGLAHIDSELTAGNPHDSTGE